KRDDRGTMMWVGLIWLLPFAGAVLYLTFGINRIKRRAVQLRGRPPRTSDPASPSERRATPVLPAENRHPAPLIEMVTGITATALEAGNTSEPLLNASQAYPAMLAAIAAARHSISLSTYIFECDEVGLEFARHLGAAVRRGVQVRVLIDATGTLLTRHSIAR